MIFHMAYHVNVKNYKTEAPRCIYNWVLISSVYSDAMYQAFKDCIISYTSECTSVERSALFTGITQHLEFTALACNDDITTDFDALL